MIDFDRPESFPMDLNNTEVNISELKRSGYNIDIGNYSDIDIKVKLNDMHLDELPLVKEYVRSHQDDEIALYQCSRILNIDSLITLSATIITGPWGSQ